MKNVPPVLRANEWEWSFDRSADAWPHYLKEIPVWRLLRQAEYMDSPLVRGTDSPWGRNGL
jgi:hypothetical protein